MKNYLHFVLSYFQNGQTGLSIAMLTCQVCVGRGVVIGGGDLIDRVANWNDNSLCNKLIGQEGFSNFAMPTI